VNKDKTLIPGQNELFPGGEFPESVMLLVGTAGSGKTAYSMQFLKEGVLAGDQCLYINCSPALTKERFNSYFTKTSATKAPAFISMIMLQRPGTGQVSSLSDLLDRMISMLQSDEPAKRIVLDSLTDLIARFPNEGVQKLVADLYDLLKINNAIALFTITGSPSAPTIDALGSLLDGIIQLRMDDSGDEVQRSARLLSLKTAHTTPKWIRFQIKRDGNLQFVQDSNNAPRADLVCKLCNGLIVGAVASAGSESPFHPQCLDTYRKLGDIYGSNILYALQPGVINANFFFIDIVGLSDPLLSVEKQIGKIEDLNALIGSCDAYNKIPNDKKIVLPTGDGMAVGFLINPELPLQLSIQLHQKLRAFNAKATSDRAIGVRIGLSTGPVFVVSDVNNNQNVWGPGIIIARRVMDLGDDGHILLADNIAEALKNLKDEYRQVIRPISVGYKIKHGQQLKLYSAYSRDFGNSTIPTRISELS
jgi:KaiC/GvpD/RAD55 family RecA-like ATPase